MNFQTNLTTIDTGSYSLACSLELGRWTEEGLSTALLRMQDSEIPPSGRLAYWSWKFVGTPFGYESALQPVGENALRVRLASFDCITFIYNVLALANAENFRSYVQRLYKIRYRSNDRGLLENNAQYGNFFDFAYESLVLNCINVGFLEDVTEEIVGSANLIYVRMKLKPFSRPADRDILQETIYPRFPEHEIKTSVIPAQRIKQIPANHFKSGDIILFTHGAEDKSGLHKQFFVCHAGVAWVRSGKVLLMHATKNYYTSANRILELRASDCLFGDQRFAQPGVALAGEYLGDQATLTRRGVKYYGYSADKERLMADYAHNFLGIKVLRPC
ncbi:N-acetylmuramoyl-L-alanine amidase-like domain-containing protein [Abyssibacter sp.]|uniref:N-acetylmuramoyl-L-alanine amidase-like domain-containing protein n=2 Tax=Abyssibacter sp. TaxID=2320200 RepID=UPI0035A3A402